MHHILEPKRPKFYSSSSDDDSQDAQPFPIESNNAPKSSTSVWIDSLNLQRKKPTKLSAEEQMEDIYHQAEMEANRRMFGYSNLRRSLSKNEFRIRKDVILYIVNERLKSNISELMDEFGDRLERNDLNDFDIVDSDNDSNDKINRFRNRSPKYDNDSLPEAPPPPNFDLSSDSSEEFNCSMAEEFGLGILKELKEMKSSTETKANQVHPVNSIQISPPNQFAAQCIGATGSTRTTSTFTIKNWNSFQQTSRHYQTKELSAQMLQCSQTGQTMNMTPWIPPVGPSQTVEQFLPQQHYFEYPPPQRTGYRPSLLHPRPRTTTNATIVNRPTVPVMSTLSPIYRPNVFATNVKAAQVSKSNYVNAVLTSEQKLSTNQTYENPIKRSGNGQTKKAQSILFPQGSIDAVNISKEWPELCKIADRLVDLPNRTEESLSLSYSRINERNEIIMILSKDPNELLLFDDKYGSNNVNWAILAAKKFLNRDKRMGGHRSIRNINESRKRSEINIHDHRSRPKNSRIPKEWIDLCKIVDKVLKTPFNVRIKLSKKDPLWEQRDNILLMLSNDPEKFASQSEVYGSKTVKWAIKSAKDLIFPGGFENKQILKTLSHQINIIERNRKSSIVSNQSKKSKPSLTSAGEQNETSEKVNVLKDKLATEESSGTKNDQLETSKDTEHRERKKKLTNEIQVSEEHKTTKNDQVTKDSGLIETMDVDIKETEVTRQQHTINTSESTGDDLNRGTRNIFTITEIAAKQGEAESSSNILVADTEAAVTAVWSELCKIVDKLLGMPPNSIDKLEPMDKRLNERNDILMILSDNPYNFSKFDDKYGSSNVSSAINSVIKLIYTNEKRNEKLNEILWEKRDAIMNSDMNSKDLSIESAEWIQIRNIATKVFQQSTENIKESSKDILSQRIELLLQLSDNPDIVRTKPICQKIGEGPVEVAIAKCKHILHRVRIKNPKLLVNFENQRSKMVLYLEFHNQSMRIKNYNVILANVRQILDRKLFHEIFGEDVKQWNQEQLLARNELAILMIKDPSMLRTNTKYLEMVGKTESGSSAYIIDEIENCLMKCEYVKEPIKLENSKKLLDCVPIIVKIKDKEHITPCMKTIFTFYIGNFLKDLVILPKPEILEIKFNRTDGTIDAVCANVMTFNWLKKYIRNFDDIWSGSQLSVFEAPVLQTAIALDGLKEIKMIMRLPNRKSFKELMKQIKEKNSRLNTERWKLPSTTITSTFIDITKTDIMVDLESLVELERMKRKIIFKIGSIFFIIKYFGKENF